MSIRQYKRGAARGQGGNAASITSRADVSRADFHRTCSVPKCSNGVMYDRPVCAICFDRVPIEIRDAFRAAVQAFQRDKSRDDDLRTARNALISAAHQARQDLSGLEAWRQRLRERLMSSVSGFICTKKLRAGEVRALVEMGAELFDSPQGRAVRFKKS